MTDYYVKKYPELKEVVDKHNLKFDLDCWGMGVIVFYEGEEIGYWFQSLNGISMQYTIGLGLHNDFHENYTLLSEGIDYRINTSFNQMKS
ncbi:hypothetical protein [Brevibacillus laterosporus]|uniref:hypothetical protein n=1 Tax=Brevibacillus laterosporus TaxID=1465 RepID=UPI000E6C2776|nr:hypothetical protein [Brevibacillus laterosporus]AYB37616.1 hypothetical protein D5F52_04585 [Brevibacillus laterosporus]MBM7110859.1 hypothetical protein [Brevibacillus laterosporus]